MLYFCSDLFDDVLYFMCYCPTECKPTRVALQPDGQNRNQTNKQIGIVKMTFFFEEESDDKEPEILKSEVNQP